MEPQFYAAMICEVYSPIRVRVIDFSSSYLVEMDLRIEFFMIKLVEHFMFRQWGRELRGVTGISAVKCIHRENNIFKTP
jgi:hypothetical protein